MTKRLNATLRSHIVQSVVGATLRDRNAAIRQRKAKLGEAVLADTLGNWAEGFAALPKRLLPQSGTVAVNLAGRSTNLPLSEDKPVPYSLFPGNGWGNVASYDARHNICKTFDAIYNDEQALKADREDLEQKLKAVVNSVATVGALLNVWPELEPMLPASCFETKANVPAVLIDSVKADLERAKKG